MGSTAACVAALHTKFAARSNGASFVVMYGQQLVSDLTAEGGSQRHTVNIQPVHQVFQLFESSTPVFRCLRMRRQYGNTPCC